MPTRPVSLLLLACVVTACSKKVAEPPPPRLEKVLPNLPLPPQGQPLVSQSGKNATQFVVVSPESPDSVAAYYRKILSEPPFRLVNENKAAGTVAFYAEQSGPSIWVTVQANGDAGSQIIIAGASDDSATVQRLRPPATRPVSPHTTSKLPAGLGG